MPPPGGCWRVRLAAALLAALPALLGPAGERARPDLVALAAPLEFETCADLNDSVKEELDYEERVEESIFDGVGEMEIVVNLGIMGTIMLVCLMEKCRMHWVPESLVVILVGVALGEGLRALIWSNYFKDDTVEKLLAEMNAPLLNMLLLPIIIFESGWSLRAMDFGSQFEHILIFAVLGSGLAMIVVASLIMASSSIHGIANWRTALVYASLIAATDPVATLATYSSLKVDPFLNIMVFGESTINDAVAITVFNILNSDAIFEKPCASFVGAVGTHFGHIVLGIAKTLFGSMLFGIVFASLSIVAIRFLAMRHSQTMETLFICLQRSLASGSQIKLMLRAIAAVGLRSRGMNTHPSARSRADSLRCLRVLHRRPICSRGDPAEHMHLSGIIAVLFCSITMGIYAPEHLSRKGYVLTSFFLKAWASLADMCVFLLVGVDSLFFARKNSTREWGLAGLVMLFSGRVQGKAAHLPKEQVLLLSWRHLFMMWHAGLRGGISLMLTLELGEWVDLQNGFGTRDRLVGCTVLVICIFLLVFGGSFPSSSYSSFSSSSMLLLVLLILFLLFVKLLNFPMEQPVGPAC
ncbi:unnamed protein product [Prorocentrum cordatum]|uniref:Cation/H+ exchanger transmembrane domain-containing protein n=1 Tax=Prorocentrum cordatum TaxID=2364126 RepID=A0ABN9TRQ1_9DINO|nr:unnamed protein product [Polarella glacialis]